MGKYLFLCRSNRLQLEKWFSLSQVQWRTIDNQSVRIASLRSVKLKSYGWSASGPTEELECFKELLLLVPSPPLPLPPRTILFFLSSSISLFSSVVEDALTQLEKDVLCKGNFYNYHFTYFHCNKNVTNIDYVKIEGNYTFSWKLNV